MVSAFHNVSAEVLNDLSATPDCDILICGDDAAAKERVSGLVKLIPGLRPLDAGSLENRVIEYVDHLHEHFLDPVTMRNGRYLAPTQPGYSIEIKAASLERFTFPTGAAWTE